MRCIVIKHDRHLKRRINVARQVRVNWRCNTSLRFFIFFTVENYYDSIADIKQHRETVLVTAKVDKTLVVDFLRFITVLFGVE